MLNRKILVCTNLIGDSIYLLWPVKRFLEQHKDEAAAIQVERGISGELFSRCFGKELPIVYSESEAKEIAPDADFLYLDASQAANICYSYAQKHGTRSLHISEGYARLLGVDIEGRQCPLLDWLEYKAQDIPKEHALIFPFSRSCSRHTRSDKVPNKTLDDHKWEPIIRFLRRHKYEPVLVSGRPEDRLHGCSILESDYCITQSLSELELMIRKASVVISVDNGLAHLASAIGTQTVILWPQISIIEFIAPIWSPETAICQIGDPAKVTSAQVLVGVRRMLAALESRHEVKNVSSPQK